jgi:hypothetical protein
MIRPLRKFHFYLWRIWGIVLPLCFIFALLFRPASPNQYNPITDDFAFAVKKLTNSSSLLTVELRNTLRAPSCLVYVSSGSDDILLGTIDHKGSYQFEFPDTGKKISIRLYDALHKRDIMQTNVSYDND